MACKNLFGKATDTIGGLVFDEDGRITDIVTPGMQTSELWPQLQGMSDAKIHKATQNRFDADFIRALEKKTNIDSADIRRIALYSKIHSKSFTDKFGDWSAGGKVSGEVNSIGEPIVNRNLEIRMGGDTISLSGDGNFSTRVTNKVRTKDMSNSKLIWTMPGSGKTELVDFLSGNQKKVAELVKTGESTEFEIFPGVQATDEQAEAITAITDFLDEDSNYSNENENKFLLRGRGGTGKTSILGKAIRNFKEGNPSAEVVYIAPTNTAAKQLAKSTGEKAHTIHAALNIKDKKGVLSLGGDHKVSKDAILVIDEASFISAATFKLISKFSENSKVIFMGDNVQLAPVDGSEAESSVFDKEHVKNTANLTKRVRQAKNSPIIGLTDVYANSVEGDVYAGKVLDADARTTNFNTKNNTGIIFSPNFDAVVDMAIKDFKANPDGTKIITYNNNQHEAEQGAGKINEHVRNVLFDNPTSSVVVGEQLVGEGSFGDISNAGKYRVTEVTEKVYEDGEYIKLKVDNKFNSVSIGQIPFFTTKLTDIDTGEAMAEPVKVLSPVYSQALRLLYNAVYTSGSIVAKGANPEAVVIAKALAANVFTQDNLSSLPFKIAFKKSLKKMFPDMSYGYALTSHKAQGSTFRNIYVMEDNIVTDKLEAKYVNSDGINRSMYVATSRASDKLVIHSKNNPKETKFRAIKYDKQGSHLASVKFKAAAPSARVGGVVDLDADIMKLYSLKDKSELIAWTEALSETELNDIYAARADVAIAAGSQVITSNMGLLKRADAAFYHTDITHLQSTEATFSTLDAENKISDVRRELSKNEKGKLFRLNSDSPFISDSIAKLDEMPTSGVTAIKALNEMIKFNPRLLRSAYMQLLGHVPSAEAQSQLLSAATDNAKELILGKIGANADTNGVITAMLVMGYDLTEIIEFLNSPNIKIIMAEAKASRDKLEKVFINPEFLNRPSLRKIAKSDEAMSLLSILEVSGDIMSFGGIRSLSEKFKIESFELDKILDGVNADALYKAIAAEDINILLDGENTSDRIFDPSLLVFYHPQSRMIFKRIYELENSILPALFPSQKALSGFLTSYDRNDEKYKNTMNYIAGQQVDAYLRSTDENGKALTASLTNGIGSITTTPYELNSVKNREEFIKDFPAYINRVKVEFRSAGIDNLALDNLSPGRMFNTNVPTLGIKGLGSVAQGEHYAPTIKRAIEDLKINTEGDSEVINKTKEDLYNNLALYALVTSGGQRKKGSMIELFTEINVDFAKFIGTLSEEFYTKILDPKNKELKKLIIGKPNTLSALVAKAEKDALKDLRGEEGAAILAQSKEAAINERENIADLTNSDAESMRISKLERRHENAKVVLKTATHTNGQVFSNDSDVGDRSGKMYYGVKTNSPLFIIKSSAELSASPSTFIEEMGTESVEESMSANEAITEIPGVPNKIIAMLAVVGKQIGQDAVLDGENVKILAYESNNRSKAKEAGSVDMFMYTVQTSDSTKSVPGAILSKQNPGLTLLGNIIEETTSALHTFATATSQETRNEKIIKLVGDNAYATSATAGLSGIALTASARAALGKMRKSAITPPILAELGLLVRAGESNVILAESDSTELGIGLKAATKFRGVGDVFSIPSIFEYDRTIRDKAVEEVKEQALNLIGLHDAGGQITFYVTTPPSDLKQSLEKGTGASMLSEITKDARARFGDNSISFERVDVATGGYSKVIFTKKITNTIETEFNGKSFKATKDAENKLKLTLPDGLSEFNAKLHIVENNLLDVGVKANVVKIKDVTYIDINVANVHRIYSRLDGSGYTYLDKAATDEALAKINKVEKKEKTKDNDENCAK